MFIVNSFVAFLLPGVPPIVVALVIFRLAAEDAAARGNKSGATVAWLMAFLVVAVMLWIFVPMLWAEIVGDK